jgi:hypothetical protein
MDHDFPAAHSMDTAWYAVDRVGQVAVFHTGESGAAPNAAFCDSAMDMLEDMPEEALEEMGLTNVDPEQLEKAVQSLQKATASLFVYDHTCENWIAGPYKCSKQPKTPLHVDQLDPDARALVAKLQFKDLEFGKAAQIQPIEHTECASWEPGYLSEDGRNIRPVPGMEDQYAERYEELLDEGHEGIQIEPPAE